MREETGYYAVAEYSTVWNEIRDTGKVVLSDQFLDNSAFVAPLVLVQTTAAGHPYYNLRGFFCNHLKHMMQPAEDC